MVDLLRAEAALRMPMDVDGACRSGPEGKEKTKGKGKTDDLEGMGKAKRKGKKGKETRVSHECNKPGHLRKDCFVCKKRIAEREEEAKRELKRQLQSKERQRQYKEQWSKGGSALKMTMLSRLVKP